MQFRIDSYVSKSRAAMERKEEAQSKKKGKAYGRVYYPVAETVDGDPMPTIAEWQEDEMRKRGNDRPDW